MRNELTALTNRLSIVILLGVAALLPLIFVLFTTEYYETVKLVFLIVASSLLLIVWSLRWIFQGKVSFIRTPLDVPILLLLIIVVLATVFTDTKNIAVYGNFPRIHGSLISWVTYILFYFIAVSQLRSKLQVVTVYYTLLGSSVIVALVTLLSYFGVYPLGNLLAFTKVLNFTPTGSSFSTVALLSLLLPLPLISILRPNEHSSSLSKYLPLPAAIVLASLFSLTIILVGNLLSYVLLAVIFGLSIYLCRNNFSRTTAIFILIPIALSLFVLGLSYLPSGKNLNPLQQKRLNFPQEIQLSFPTSWKVSASAFRDAPFLGTGPGTYLFDFSLYKPAEHNSNPNWNIRFDSAFNEFLQILATFGGLGFLALIFLAIVILVFARSRLAQKDDPFITALAISSIIVVLLLIIHASTLVSIVVSLFILMLLVGAYKSSTGKTEELTLGIQASKLTDSELVSNLIIGDLLPLILIIPISIGLVYILWNGQKALLADYHHRIALNAAATNSLATYNNLVRSEQLNPYIDLYHTDLAQTNFVIANAIAAQKGPTPASPSGSLTDTDKQNIQTLLSQSINEARIATSLSPQNAQNWEILASIYRQISGVAQNALSFSLDAYGKAIARDPLNPLLRLNVGGVYYSIKNYDLAIRFFTDAVNLKPDYANAYYNLSVALRDKGDLQGALQTAQAVVSLLDTKSPDYKIASDYLADLKARIATASSTQAQTTPGQITPPAAQENGALQKKELPKVLDNVLPNKAENIATPDAIKK